jgi:hypothetical protein
MIIILTKILLAFSCGLMDRFRGDKINVFQSKPVESVIYGLFVGALFLTEWWHVVIFAGLWAVGAAFGWGTPLGAMLGGREMEIEGNEWWQFWIFNTRVVPACILRGVMWGACVLPVAYFDPKAGVFVFAMGAIFPLAIWAAKKFPKIVNVDGWALQEFIRGWTVGAVALLLNLA